MSVSFYVDTPITGWVVSCSCGNATSGVFGSYGDASDAHQSGLIVACGDEFCAGYPATVTAQVQDSVEEVNVSNINARHLLSILGYEGDADLSGSATGADLMGRILMAEAINPTDEGTATITEGILTTFGRPEGYTEARLAAIKPIAQYAMDHNLNVLWG